VFGRSGANAGAAPDCLQRPLRSRFRQQVSASVSCHMMIFVSHNTANKADARLLAAALAEHGAGRLVR
jgi:hypothetical protein